MDDDKSAVSRVRGATWRPLSFARREAALKALAERPDGEIDYSDIPELDDAFWARAVPNPFFRPVKTHASVRIDADVLAWLKSGGKGYQTRLNAILREAMLRARQKPAGAAD
ncbi:MAG: toxin-antitoxin system, antitoxin component [Rhodocyclaceae bacterium]|nr:toxin-antitoxin system, antitoxin component [Rhodocyclaceae bacterium]